MSAQQVEPAPPLTFLELDHPAALITRCECCKVFLYNLGGGIGLATGGYLGSDCWGRERLIAIGRKHHQELTDLRKQIRAEVLSMIDRS